MTSDESDDEPLSVLAAAKKNNPEKFVDISPFRVRKSKKKRKLDAKKLSLTIKLNLGSKKSLAPAAVVERPVDVWLYLKDLNLTGPYSCLLCSEWFINRSKIIVHYVINHKKDYCGICRYFVSDREAWVAHGKFHTPWPCSQCIENFETEQDLRQHLSKNHKLVHCRLCHFRVPDDEQYHTHLFQKHSVHNVSSKDRESLWDVEYEGSNKFLCLLCSKSNILLTNFFSHYMGYHHITIKCLTNIISGKDQPFNIYGADVRPEFIEDQLKSHGRYGYVDLDIKPIVKDESVKIDDVPTKIEDSLTENLMVEVKQEVLSDDEKNDELETSDDIKIRDEDDITNTYKGEEDFDMTLVELVVLNKCYFNYVNEILNDIKSNFMPLKSEINFDSSKEDPAMDVLCSICKTKQNSVANFIMHMFKMHGVKSIPVFCCRVCATTFESQSELETHMAEELKEFENLWLCQFCDNEFDNRESTRQHLSEHWKILEYDNCFSPHLGFKCKYCPTLFWNETDRETHQMRVHLQKHPEDLYKCHICSESFGDKVWFIHHYMDVHQISDEIKQTYLLKCCLCGVVLPDVDTMRRHFLNQHKEAKKVFCCLDNCRYRPLSHRKSFKMHLKTVHSKPPRVERTVGCSYCGREFASARACSAHTAQVHSSAKFKCKICKEIMHTMDERKLHYLIRHPGRHPFECTECGKSFQYKSSLYMHKQDHQPNKQEYTCKYCNKVFKKRDSFREHVLIHEGPRHACSYCPMRFVQRSNMLRHERRHTGERPYHCPHCDRSFADKGACTSHTRTHSNDRSYPCLYCGQTFVQKSKLKYHIRKHTGENLETCTVCSKLFTSGCSLREHMKIHEAKKTVRCPLCDRKYQDERYMLRHLRTAHTKARFTCPICRMNVKSQYGLKSHVLTHSGRHPFLCKLCPKTYSRTKAAASHLRLRHGVKKGEVCVKQFFNILDPRDCQLGIDEEVITKIFGPRKKKTNDAPVGDFVTFKNAYKFAPNATAGKTSDENTDEESDGNEENESEMEKEDDGDEGKKEKKQSNESGGELEPTDFVSVKIEPMEYSD